jgi:hypothetical protein
VRVRELRDGEGLAPENSAALRGASATA